MTNVIKIVVTSAKFYRYNARNSMSARAPQTPLGSLHAPDLLLDFGERRRGGNGKRGKGNEGKGKGTGGKEEMKRRG